MPQMMPPNGHIAILLSFSGQGGVERMILNLAGGFVQSGHRVDLLTLRNQEPESWGLPQGVRHMPLRARHSLTAIPELAHYLRRQKPDCMLAAKDRAGRAAILARILSGRRTPLAIRLGTHLSASLTRRPRIQRMLRILPMRFLYPRADLVIAVSEGVRTDTLTLTGMAAQKVHTAPNPVISPKLFTISRHPVEHPWLCNKKIPVILAAGRLTRQKAFDVLIDAFARMRRNCAARLIIAGEGAERSALEEQAKHLGVAEDVCLPGFQRELAAWLIRADLFVLSSRWEGSPNVLTEALALGIPSVATRCPAGPEELLRDSHHRALVEVDDAHGLAVAMQEMLLAPPEAETLRRTVRAYSIENSSRVYLQLLGEIC